MTRENVIAIREWFADFCKSFYSSDEEFQRNISLKEKHTYHVTENALRIGRDESLDEEALMLVEVAALLHDVGRFEQYRQFRTFKDSISVNHGELGAQILEDYEVLAPLYPHERSLLDHVVSLHNAFAVPRDLPEETRFSLRLLRDADKLDIWRVFIEYYRLPGAERASAAGLGLPDKPKCTPAVIDHVLNRRLVRLSAVRTLNDFKLMQLSWVFDLNFAATCRLLIERDCIRSLVATLPKDDQVNRAVAVVREHVQCRAQSPDS